MYCLCEKPPERHSGVRANLIAEMQAKQITASLSPTSRRQSCDLSYREQRRRYNDITFYLWREAQRSILHSKPRFLLLSFFSVRSFNFINKKQYNPYQHGKIYKGIHERIRKPVFLSRLRVMSVSISMGPNK